MQWDLKTLNELEPPCKQGSKLRIIQASVRSFVATCRRFGEPIATAKKEKTEPRGSVFSFLVRARGLEPPQPCDHKNLNLTRLPIPPSPHPVLRCGFAT